MKQYFESWNPSPRSQMLLRVCNEVLDEYREMGYKLTLRQLYYQLVSRDVIDNNVSQYNSLGGIISKGRMAGLVDWSMIEDRVRVPKSNTHWKTPEQILRAAASGFYMDRWERQKNYVEVWCEKDAVSNIIEPVCRRYDVIFMANRGYSSASAMYEAYRRMTEMKTKGKACHVIYLGDHDPSGIDMSRDISDRMSMFLDVAFYSYNHRVALNMDQVDEYDPPTNPAKMTDSRFDDYVTQFGKSCWELDALRPDVLEQIVTDAILDLIDMDEFKEVEQQEEEHKEKLIAIADKGIS